MSRKPGTRYANHPIVRFVRGLDGEFYLRKEVADQLDCSDSMLELLRRQADRPLGPTHQAQYGGITLHLYTPERIAEIGAYIKEKSRQGQGYKRKGPVLLWTRAEQLARTRDLCRARNYRVRGAAYTAQGKATEAARMEKMNAALMAKLAKDKEQRYQKVHGKAFNKAT